MDRQKCRRCGKDFPKTSEYFYYDKSSSGKQVLAKKCKICKMLQAKIARDIVKPAPKTTITLSHPLSFWAAHPIDGSMKLEARDIPKDSPEAIAGRRGGGKGRCED